MKRELIRKDLWILLREFGYDNNLNLTARRYVDEPEEEEETKGVNETEATPTDSVEGKEREGKKKGKKKKKEEKPKDLQPGLY